MSPRYWACLSTGPAYSLHCHHGLDQPARGQRGLPGRGAVSAPDL